MNNKLFFALLIAGLVGIGLLMRSRIKPHKRGSDSVTTPTTSATAATSTRAH